MSTKRTKPQYRTFGPEDGTGRTWQEFFKEVKHGVEVDPDAIVDSDDHDGEVESIGEVELVLPAVEVPDSWADAGMPKALRTWRTRLLANDWRFKVGGSVTWHPDSYYKNGNLKKSAHWVDCWWINATRDGIYITITYFIRDGENYSGWTSRTAKHEWFKLYSNKEMKELIESGQ